MTSSLDTPEAFGAAIRAARKRHGLKQEDVALAAGVGIRFLSELERGKQTAQLGAALRVAAALDLRLHAKPGDE